MVLLAAIHTRTSAVCRRPTPPAEATSTSLRLQTGTCTVIIALTQKETYRPILLERKAARLRAQTGDARYHSPLELTQRHSLAGRLAQTFTRPFVVFVREPTLIATTVYLAFIGGCLYMLFEAYPIVFEVGYHFKPAQLGLAYLPLTVGNIVAVVFVRISPLFLSLPAHSLYHYLHTQYLLVIQPSYERRVGECAPAPVPPEERLKAAIWAAPLFAVSFFWFGWTSFPTISFWAPLMSGFTLGIATLALLVALMNYVVGAFSFFARPCCSRCCICPLIVHPSRRLREHRGVRTGHCHRPAEHLGRGLPALLDADVPRTLPTLGVDHRRLRRGGDDPYPIRPHSVCDLPFS